jgi:hypothetical protein
MTLKSDYEAADQKRSAFLERARDCAALTMADVLPRQNMKQDQVYQRAYRALGHIGIENLVGRLLVALYPPGIAWFRFSPSAEVKADPSLVPEEFLAFEGYLYGRELLVQSKLESTNYRVVKRTALESILVAGNALTHLTDDYRLKYYRLDNWIPQRDGSGELIGILLRESKDVRRISEKILSKAHLKRNEEDPEDRNKIIYTFVELQRDNRWTIRQELNDRTILESEEPVNPYFAVGYRLTTGENHARGFVEGRLPELISYNSLWQSLVQGLAAAARCVPVVDPTQGFIRPSDLMKENGVPLTGKLNENAIPTGVGFLQTQKAQDFSIARTGAMDIEASLGKAMLLESEAMPTGERVTATAVMRIAKELEGGLGSPYTNIAAEDQKPLIDRLVYQMERDNLLTAHTGARKKLADTVIETGVAALGRQIELEKLLNGINVLSQFPGALERLNLEVVSDRILRYIGIDTNGLIKSDEQIAAELQQAMQAQMQTAAGQQAISSIGKIVEQKAGEARQ